MELIPMPAALLARMLLMQPPRQKQVGIPHRGRSTKYMRDPITFRHDLVLRANLARSYHDIWAAISGPGLLPHYSQTLNEHGYLSKGIEIGIRQAFVITLCSLYDRDPKAISIQRFANYLHKQNKLDPQWNDCFTSAQNRAKRLAKLRNKYFAHDSEEKYLTNFWKEAGFTFNELTAFMKESWHNVAALVFADDHSEMIYKCDPRPDIIKLFPSYNPRKTWG